MFTITKVIVASLALGAVQALPQRLGARQDMVASASSAAPAAPSSTPDIFDDLLTAPTAIKRFQRLLTTGPSNDAELLTGDALRNATVFTFTKPAKKSTPGGTAVAAVSLITHSKDNNLTNFSTRTSVPFQFLLALVSAPL